MPSYEELVEQVKQLEQQLTSLQPLKANLEAQQKLVQARFEALDELEAQRWTPSGYLRTERFPGLVTQSNQIFTPAGSLEARVERFKFQEPDSIGVDVTLAGTYTATDRTNESGLLVGIGLFVSTSLSAGNFTEKLEIVMDDVISTILLNNNNTNWTGKVYPWTQRVVFISGSGVHGGRTEGDDLRINLNLPYDRNLKVSVIIGPEVVVTGLHSLVVFR